MARLPVPGSDQNTWGDILNVFLSQAHKADGTLKDGIITNNHIGAGGISQSAIIGLSTALAGKVEATDIVEKGELTLNAKDYGAVGNGIADDTAALQAAITAAEGAASRTLLIPKGNYKVTDTLMIQEATGVRIIGYGAYLKVAVTAGKPAIEMKTTSANYAKGRKTVIEGLAISSTSNGVGIGIYVNYAQEWYLHNVQIEYFAVGLQLFDTYYGGVGGYTVLLGNVVGLDIIGNEVNTVAFANVKINGAGALGGQTTYGMRSVAIMNLLKFDGLTIEGYNYGFVYSRQEHATGIIKLNEVYFEAITTCATDFTPKVDIASIMVQIDNCHFAEDNKNDWIKLGTGNYYIHNCNFKSNRIYIKNTSSYRVNLNTDIAASQLDFAATQAALASDGLVQVNGRTAVFTDGNAYQYNTKGDYNVYPTAKNHLPSIIDQTPTVAVSPFDGDQMGKIYPAMTVNYRDVVFENKGVVLKSPNGTYYRLAVANDGTLSTKNVSTIKRSFAPSLISMPAIEIGRREVRGTTYAIADGKTLIVVETGRKVIKTSGVVNDVTYAGRVFGTTLEAVSTTFGSVYYVPFFWDTDIEYFYCWQGTYWGWSGSDASDATNIRAIGTLAQRPVSPALTYMQYYATDITTRYTWNGSVWA